MKKLKAVCALSLAGLLLFSLKKLTVYWGALEDFMAADVAAFEKETGIKVTAIRLSSGEALKRLKLEKAAPKASVWFGGPADGQIQAKADGLLEKNSRPVQRFGRFLDRRLCGLSGFFLQRQTVKGKESGTAQKLERPAETGIPGTDCHA